MRAVCLFHFLVALFADDFLPLFTSSCVKFIIMFTQFPHCCFFTFIQSIQILSPIPRAQCCDVSCRTKVPSQSAVMFPAWTACPMNLIVRYRMCFKRCVFPGSSKVVTSGGQPQPLNRGVFAHHPLSQRSRSALKDRKHVVKGELDLAPKH